MAALISSALALAVPALPTLTASPATAAPVSAGPAAAQAIGVPVRRPQPAAARPRLGAPASSAGRAHEASGAASDRRLPGERRGLGPSGPASLTTSQVAEQAMAADGMVALVPVRMLDTRRSLGIAGRFTAGRAATLQVAGRGGVPAQGVSAVMLSMSAVLPSANGYLSVYATGRARPATSALTYERGRTTTTGVIATLGSGGTVTVYSPIATDVVADVVGWFGPSGPYRSVAPTRVVDTRTGLGLPKARLAGASVSTFSLSPAALPGGTTAVAVTAVAVNETGNGFAALYATGTARSASYATFPYLKARTVSNVTIVPLGSGGRLSLYVATSTDVVLDVVGAFVGGSTYHPITPVRAFDSKIDTRDEGGAAYPLPPGDDYAWDLSVVGMGGVPLTGVAAVVVNLTTSDTTNPTSLTMWPTPAGVLGATRPGTAVMATGPGQARSVTTMVRVGSDGLVRIYNEAGTTHVKLDVIGWVSTTGVPRPGVGRQIYPTIGWGGQIDQDTTLHGVSDSARYALLAGPAEQLVPYGTVGRTTLAIRDTVLSLTTSLSEGSAGRAAISGDGGAVAWTSTRDLAPADGNATGDVYWMDVAAAQLWLVSAPPAGLPGAEPDANGASSVYALSTDGRYVVVRTLATNLDADGRAGIFLADLDARASGGSLSYVSGAAPSDQIAASPAGDLAWNAAGTVRLKRAGAGSSTVVGTGATGSPVRFDAGGARLVWARDAGHTDEVHAVTVSSGADVRLAPATSGASSADIAAAALSADGTTVELAVSGADAVLPEGTLASGLVLAAYVPGSGFASRLTGSTTLGAGLDTAAFNGDGTWAVATTRDPALLPAGVASLPVAIRVA